MIDIDPFWSTRFEPYAENIAGTLGDVRHNGLNVVVRDLSCHGIQIHGQLMAFVRGECLSEKERNEQR